MRLTCICDNDTVVQSTHVETWERIPSITKPPATAVSPAAGQKMIRAAGGRCRRVGSTRYGALWLRSFLDVTLALIVFEDLAQVRQRESAAGKMDGDKPGGDQIDELVEQIGVGDAIDCGADGKEEEEDVRYVAETVEDRVLGIRSHKSAEKATGSFQRNLMVVEAFVKLQQLGNSLRCDSRDHFPTRQGFDQY